MIKVAARMEKKDGQVKFTDVIEYDAEKNNWYIPGLWHGTPPMAPVSTGYSETVFEFKKSLIDAFKGANHRHGDITEFIKWMESLWKAVKHENFIFSFRNCLVADAYNNLSVEFNQWEWSFRKHMLIWTQQAENKIQNFGNMDSHLIENIDDFVISLKCEGAKELKNQEKEFLKHLDDYYKSKEKHVQLVEKYKESFVSSIKSITFEIESEVNRKFEMAVTIQKGKNKLASIHMDHANIIEKRVLELLEKCRKNNLVLSDENLNDEFEIMWEETVRGLNFKGLMKKDISVKVFGQLRINLERHGSAVNEKLNAADLKEPAGKFMVCKEHLDGWLRQAWHTYIKKTDKPQNMADRVISDCIELIDEKALSDSDYHDTYTTELLHIIDEKVKDTGTSNTFEVDLKLHICRIATKQFQKIHDDFIAKNDPQKHLEGLKPNYFSDFIDLYQEKNQCQKKASEFITLCLEPAIRDYIKKNLGVKIIDEILVCGSSVKISSRTQFQFTLLEELLNKNEFKEYIRYVRYYEDYVKEWILDLIQKHFSVNKSIVDLEKSSLSEIIAKIKEAFSKAKTKTILSNSSKGTTDFIHEICKHLKADLVINIDNLRTVLTLNDAKMEEFAKNIEWSLDDLEKSLQNEYSDQQECDESKDIKKKIRNLPVKPHDEIFRRVFGCGKQCPFCKVPCEAGGKDHEEHFATVHRPRGIGGHSYISNENLVEDICTTGVASETHSFKNKDTNHEWHPYKEYRKYYPDWNIPQDTSIEASAYWQFVMLTHNEQFAQEYSAKPAVIPEQWCTVTQSQAMDSLKVLFNIK
ncbi:GVIN1 GTPase, partial [Polypterus senegalus]